MEPIWPRAAKVTMQTFSKANKGFTLIELLVVMIIMSILMAAAIPMYTGHKDKARVSNTKVHMRYVMNYLEDCAAGNMGSYRLCSVQALKDSDPGLYKDLMRDNGRMWFCDKTNNLGDLSTPDRKSVV